LLLIFKII